VSFFASNISPDAAFGASKPTYEKRITGAIAIKPPSVGVNPSKSNGWKPFLIQ
jgi:hypothetical protein